MKARYKCYKEIIISTLYFCNKRIPYCLNTNIILLGSFSTNNGFIYRNSIT